MYISASWPVRAAGVSAPPVALRRCCNRPSPQACKMIFPFCPCPLASTPRTASISRAQMRNSQFGAPVVKPASLEEEEEAAAAEEEEMSVEDEDELPLDEFDRSVAFEDDGCVPEDAELYVGDGGGGGGISLAGTWWDKEVFAIAEDVSVSLGGGLKIYAFKTMGNASIQVRIENMSNKSGSPSMSDIEAFSSTYRARLDEAGLAKSVPENLTIEVSSPGVERVVRIPRDLDHFKDRPMYVKYRTGVAANGSSTELDGIFRLISFDLDASYCTWGLADVKKNREKTGKGRPLSKKQREWQLNTPFDSLCLVRLYSDA